MEGGGRASSEWSSPAGLSRAPKGTAHGGGGEEAGEGEGLQRVYNTGALVRAVLLHAGSFPRTWNPSSCEAGDETR